MIIRSLVVGVASLVLVACEPIETDGTTSETVETVSAGATAMPSGLSGEQQGIWNTFSDAGKKVVSDCMASGKSFAACTAI